MSTSTRKPLKKKKLRKKRPYKRSGKRTEFDPCFALDIYELAKAGMARAGISKALGVSRPTIRAWEARYPLVAEALRRGYLRHREPFHKYLYRRLTPEVQKIWDDLNVLDLSDKKSQENIDKLLTGSPKPIRQQLFVYSLVHHNFSKAAACRMTGLDIEVVDRWAREDPEFAQLMNGVNEVKKDFFESGLIQLVANGSERAIIFANKTVNKDRGYSEKLEVEHKGKIEHDVNVTMIDELGLPLSIRRKILIALEEKELQDSLDSDVHTPLLEHSRNGKH